MMIIEYLKSVFLGIVEGITEWLPISSTGHMILVNGFMNTEKTFFDSQIYLYVIQLGAILAIATLYFGKLNPFAPSKTKAEKANTWTMWFKVIIGCIPAAVIGLALNDFMEQFSTPVIVAAMLILYGIGFLFIEKRAKAESVKSITDMSYKTALFIGLFQALSVVPGTSRSGSSILGAMILGTSRPVAAEFSFFMAIPVMVGVSFLKIITNDYVMTPHEWGLLLTGMLTAYLISLASVKFLMNYVRKHDFKAFGWYRIVLGIIVLVTFAFRCFA